MTKTSTSDALKALASGTDARSETAKLRDVFDDVENALKAGVKRQAVLETLKDAGINLTLKGFDTALHRIRKQRKKAQEKPAATPQSVTPKENYSGISQNQETKENQKPKLNENIQKSEATDAKSLFADVATKPDEGKHNPLSKKYT